MEFANLSCGQLPQTAGTYQLSVPLAPSTWFRVGGVADIVFKPTHLRGLRLFLKQRSRELPYTLLGVGSNVLVRDGGIRGVVIRLHQGFRTFLINDDTIDVGAGMLDRTVAEYCCAAGIGGFEFLSTIPGTIGGALRMNAGAYGREIKDCLIHALAMDPKGYLHRLVPEDMGYGYRTCALPADWIFVGARLKGFLDLPSHIRKRMDECANLRAQTQPTHGRTGGSTFANPNGVRAWELIDQAGCRGLTQGDASVSTKHCNFLINTGNACASDLENLAEDVRARVLAHSGIDLRWEIVRLGEAV